MSIACRETTQDGGNLTKTRELTAEIRHRAVEHVRSATLGDQAAWSAYDHFVIRTGRSTLTLFAVAAIFAFIPRCVRAETHVSQTNEMIAAAYGEWWDSTGTVFTVVLSNVVSQTDHGPGGEQDSVTYGQVVFVQHDSVTGEDYLGYGHVDQAPTFRGHLTLAFYEIEIPVSRYDRATGEYVDAGAVTIKINLEGYGPITKLEYPTTSNEEFVSMTRNAMPTFAIDGSEVDAGLFEFADGYITDDRAKYKYTLKP